MSRLYFTATMKHSSLGIDLPVFSFATADYSGGSYHIKGLHPSAIAALGGKGPELKKQERFDIKCNLNKKRAAISLIVNTKKHIPHVEWSTEDGLGPLPIGLSTIVPMIIGSKSSSKTKRVDERESGSERSRSQRSSSSRRARESHYNDRYDDRYDDQHDDWYNENYDRYEDHRDEKTGHYDDRRERRRSESDSRSRR